MITLTRAVTITVVHGDVPTQDILGFGYSPDPRDATKLRKIWGLADRDGATLSSMSYLWEPAHGSTPALMLADMDKAGTTRFYFHTGGSGLWAPVTELRRALRELGAVAPAEINGVPVPEEITRNWGEVETEWWRRGVVAATAHVANELRRAAMLLGPLPRTELDTTNDPYASTDEDEA